MTIPLQRRSTLPPLTDKGTGRVADKGHESNQGETTLTRIRSIIATCAFALLVPALVAGCGGDDESSEVDPQTVIDETFNDAERVSSGDLSLTVGGSAEGEEGGSFEASLTGPFQGDPDDPNALPQLDWTGSVSGESAGQSISFEGGITVTEDNAYVEYGGNAYEVGTEIFAQFKEAAEQAAAQQTEAAEGQSFGELFAQQCESQIQAVGGDPAACDVDFESWLGDLTNDGEEEIEGAPTTHISGTVDVETMLRDLVELASSVPQASADAPTDEQVQQVVDAVEEASFDLYSGTDDNILRGLDFNLAIDPTAIPDAEASGIESIDANFSMRLGAVNEEQEIEAPTDARPLEDLLGQFGIDPGSLGGLGGLSGGGGAVPEIPGGGGGGAGDADAYLDCIAAAGNDADAINACASEL